MKTYKFYPILLIIPLFIVAWGLFNLYFFDTFYSRAIDPEYPYLINGLNVALLKFNRIGHFDHPGTPFQVFCGVIIRITHLFTGKDSIAQDVFNRPDYYLNAISFSLILLQSLLTLLIGWIGKKRGIKIWQLVILQAGVLFNVLMLWMFYRVFPERWLVIVALLFIIAYLLYGYKERKPLKFAIWSGIIMGMGMATKFNFLPILILPFLLIHSNKNRLIYAGTGIASFFFFLLPVIKKFGDYRRFITSIATHDGIYGQGAERMFDPAKMKESISQIFNVAPELMFVIFAIIAAIILAVLYRKTHKTNINILFFTGMFFIVLLQIVMVSKHFKNTYLIPVFTIYPLFLFLLDDFIHKIIPSKIWKLTPVVLLFVIFTGFSTKQVFEDIKPISENIAQRETMRKYVSENLPPNAFWFVEPTWESAPYVENGIIYGLCYCHHREDYAPVLMNKNPNLLVHSDDEGLNNIWKEKEIRINGIITTGIPVYVYSSPGRNADALIKVLEAAAERNQVVLTVETVFSNDYLKSHIIAVQNKQSQDVLSTEKLEAFLREAKIQEAMQAIYNTPDWLKTVEDKAKEKNIPLDSMVLLDAIWVVDNP